MVSNLNSHALLQLWFQITFVDIFTCFDHREENRIYQRYYQWISLVFILQAAVLYMPAYFWKLAEGGLMHKLCDKLGLFF